MPLMCVAANPTLMAFHPLKTCWPTLCWGSLCGWSLPPLVSATSLWSACAHMSDLRINSTPCASSPSAVSHNTVKLNVHIINYYMNYVFIIHSDFIILILIYAVHHEKKPMCCHLDLEAFFICRSTDFVQREKVALKMWSYICKIQQRRFTSRGSLWASLMVTFDWHSVVFFITGITIKNENECGKQH